MVLMHWRIPFRKQSSGSTAKKGGAIVKLIDALMKFVNQETCPVNDQCIAGFVAGANTGWGWARTRVHRIIRDNPIPMKGPPDHAVCFFRDGNKWCCVNGDFVNLQESPAGFGNTFDEALSDLKRFLPHVHVAGEGKDIDTCKRCGHDIRNVIHIRMPPPGPPNPPKGPYPREFA